MSKTILRYNIIELMPTDQNYFYKDVSFVLLDQMFISMHF